MEYTFNVLRVKDGQGVELPGDAQILGAQGDDEDFRWATLFYLTPDPE